MEIKFNKKFTETLLNSIILAFDYYKNNNTTGIETNKEEVYAKHGKEIDAFIDKVHRGIEEKSSTVMTYTNTIRVITKSGVSPHYKNTIQAIGEILVDTMVLYFKGHGQRRLDTGRSDKLPFEDYSKRICNNLQPLKYSFLYSVDNEFIGVLLDEISIDNYTNNTTFVFNIFGHMIKE